MADVSINDAKGYPCPKDGAVMTIIEGGAWCPTCHTVWREIGEVDLADLDALPTPQRCYVHTFVTIDKCGCPPDPTLQQFDGSECG